MFKIEDYAKAVLDGVQLVLTHDSDSAEAMAQVLLSAYNSYEYNLSIADLGCLDDNYFDIAIKIITLRGKYRREPHEFISNGDEIFLEIKNKWDYLHVDVRNKK